MVRIDALLRRLEEEQAQLAKAAMEQPQAHDLFSYGRAVGLYAGLEHAKTIVMTLLEERERKDFNL